ncbi:MAG: toll/interleukin-1 receptor domain-containing protein, partial [Thiohalocapsa sp.]|uniref:toll/interleukin-1 receptor domain-containing protein n=1 Tax=Thiohalocapsa sp. TaxID=2497641 RepID=UPI0025EBCB04
MTDAGYPFQLFLSYARKDNQPPPEAAGAEGWVTAFERTLRERHGRWSSRALNIFFDQQSIDDCSDWRRRLSEGLRQSRLLLAFLSPNYICSANCLWEWEEYLKREHTSARGDDGILPVFFVKPRDLTIGDEEAIADWLARMERCYPWFRVPPALLAGDAERMARAFARDLHRRQRGLSLELADWYRAGPGVLRELDAAARSAEVTARARAEAGAKRGGLLGWLRGRAPATTAPPTPDPQQLAARMDAIGRHIARRLNRIRLADLAPTNVARGHEHFVGRHAELTALHDTLIGGGEDASPRGGGCGLIAAAHSPGGLGKTALARQYAHAYAEYYAAGGTWEVPCEGARELGEALLRLVERGGAFASMGAEVGIPLALTDAQKQDFSAVMGAVMDYLRRVTERRAPLLRERLALPADCPAADAAKLLPPAGQPRALLILDNVTDPALLGASQLGDLPNADWLEVIVTTRLDPADFGAGARWHHAIEVPPLPPGDALDLLRDFQPERRFAADPAAEAAETEAARHIVAALGGYTLAVELVGAHLGTHAGALTPRGFVERFRAEGLMDIVDPLADEDRVAAQIRHQQRQVGTVLDWSLARLSATARTALGFAALLQPDRVPLPWLQWLTRNRHPDALTERPGHPDPWVSVWQSLTGLRLLKPAGESAPERRGPAPPPTLAAIHRLVAAHAAATDPEPARTWAELDNFLDALTTAFEQQVGQGDDDWLRAQHPWLLEHLAHLIAPAGDARPAHPPTPTLLRSAGVAASYEAQHGAFARALRLTEQILAEQERILAATPATDPAHAQAARDVSVSLNKLA